MRWRRTMEEELDRDIADHIARETEENIARGLSPREARFAALRKFGNIGRVKEDTRSVWAWGSLDTWYGDVRQAFRRMRRGPGTAALAVLSLALAFAPSVTVFSVMDRLFLTPIPVRDPGEIVQIPAKALQGLVFLFGSLVRDTLVSPHVFQRLVDLFLRHPLVGKQLPGPAPR